MDFRSRAFLHLCIPAFLTLASAVPARAQIFESVGIRAQGMGGAFVAVSDDATATWWNPAGLAGGAYFSSVFESDRVDNPSMTRARAIALTVPSLGLSYYRLALSGIGPPASTESAAANRQDQGVLSQFGVTLGQSIGDRLVVASTLKLVRAMDQTRGDLDVGALATVGWARFGLAVKNLRASDFSAGDRQLELPRQVRAGLAIRAGAASRPAVTLAVDADLTTTPTPFGDERHLAAGVEAWAPNRRLAARVGVGVNTLGESRRSGSVGASLALRRGLYVDGQLTGGSDEARNSWGLGVRVTF